MSVVRWISKNPGHAVVRCDGCGILTSAKDCSYRRPDGTYGYIHGHGLNHEFPECTHDWCTECAAKAGDDERCPLCVSASESA